MKINLLTKEEFFDKLDHGCQIRVTYDKLFHDDCENHGWWSEELWCYDKKTDMYRCYYPVSSYKKGFYTKHTRDQAETFYGDIKWALKNNELKNIQVEKIECILENKSIREYIMNKINNMSEDELTSILVSGVIS